jgi:hypothetical protein
MCIAWLLYHSEFFSAQIHVTEKLSGICIQGFCDYTESKWSHLVGVGVSGSAKVTPVTKNIWGNRGPNEFGAECISF